MTKVFTYVLFQCFIDKGNEENPMLVHEQCHVVVPHCTQEMSLSSRSSRPHSVSTRLHQCFIGYALLRASNAWQGAAQGEISISKIHNRNTP